MLAQVGEGWVAEEALAIGYFAALCYPDDVIAGLRLAVNHSGDSDSTGSIADNLLGAMLGRPTIPDDGVARLHQAELVERVANGLL